MVVQTGDEVAGAGNWKEGVKGTENCVGGDVKPCSINQSACTSDVINLTDCCFDVFAHLST